MKTVYENKIINCQEQSAVKLRDGALIIKTTVNRFDSIKPSKLTYGIMIEDTEVRAIPAERDKLKIKIVGGEEAKKQLFKADFNFQSLGIGGLDKEFAEIFRRAFNSRRYP